METDLTRPLPDEKEARQAFVDALLEVLCNERRRFLLHQLSRSEGAVELPVVARQLAAYEDGMDPEDVTDDAAKRVYNALYQSHVPKLEDYGLVRYDADARTVSLASGDALRHVRRIEGAEPKRNPRYGAVLASVGWLGAGTGFAPTILQTPLGELVTVAFAILIVAFYRNRVPLFSGNLPQSPFDEFQRD